MPWSAHRTLLGGHESVERFVGMESQCNSSGIEIHRGTRSHSSLQGTWIRPKSSTEGETLVDQAKNIESYLLELAELNMFWIVRTEHIQPGLIQFLGRDGVAYSLMDDDGTRVEMCIEFLVDRGCPAFNDVGEEERYVAQLRAASR